MIRTWSLVSSSYQSAVENSRMQNKAGNVHNLQYIVCQTFFLFQLETNDTIYPHSYLIFKILE